MNPKPSSCKACVLNHCPILPFLPAAQGETGRMTCSTKVQESTRPGGRLLTQALGLHFRASPPACTNQNPQSTQDPAKLPEARILGLFTESPGPGGRAVSWAQKQDKGKLSARENHPPPQGALSHCMSPSSKGLCVNLKNQTDLSVGVTYITRLQVPLSPLYAGAGSACLLLP